MSIVQALRGKSLHNCILRRFHLKNFAHDSTKTSATSASATAGSTQAPNPGPFTISGISILSLI